MPPATLLAHAKRAPLAHALAPASVHEARPAWRLWMAGARVGIGAVFLWAFVDKLLGLGFATPAERAWMRGGSPTRGYLSSSEGPLAGLFQAMAGHPVTDALFMGGLAAVGAALILGIGMRLAAVGGSAMLLMMYVSHPPWLAQASTNPVVDDHIIYALVLAALALAHAGRDLGLGRAWERSALVRRMPWLA